MSNGCLYHVFFMIIRFYPRRMSSGADLGFSQERGEADFQKSFVKVLLTFFLSQSN